MNPRQLDPEVLNRALLELAAGEPDWVVVDRRVLNLLLGPLADLLVQMPYRSGPLPGSDYDPDDDGYVWDLDDLC